MSKKVEQKTEHQKALELANKMYKLGLHHGRINALNELVAEAKEHNYTTESHFMGAIHNLIKAETKTYLRCVGESKGESNE